MLLPAIKLGIGIAASVGVQKIVKDVVRNSVVVATRADAIKVWTGTFVIGAVIAEQATKHVDSTIDKLAELYEKQQESKDETPELVS